MNDHWLSCYVHLNKLPSVFHSSVLLLIINFIITLSKLLWIHKAPSGYTDYFDNVTTKFIATNRADALKADINLFFAITNNLLLSLSNSLLSLDVSHKC